jgi:hypothetical protein
MNLPHPKCATHRTTACCEAGLCLPGFWALLAWKRVAAVLLACCYGAATVLLPFASRILISLRISYQGRSVRVHFSTTSHSAIRNALHDSMLRKMAESGQVNAKFKDGVQDCRDSCEPDCTWR